MKILVTGAAGFIGSHLAEHLAASGHAVAGIDCMLDNYALELKELNASGLAKAGVAFSKLDLAAADLIPVLRDVEIVFHGAAQPGLAAATPFETFARNNITATHRLLDAAKRSDAIRAFVYLSTSSVYGADATGDEHSEPRPTSYYGVTKLAAEQLILAAARDLGFPGCSMRLFSVYGPRERPEKLYPRLIRAILEGKEFPLFEGSDRHLRSFTYVGDIVKGLAAVLSNPDRCAGEVFNLGSDTALSTGEGIRIVEKIIGKPARIALKPKRPGDQLRTHANIGKARAMLGYNPETTAREGLAREVEWYQREVVGKVDANIMEGR